eukprot:8634393-Prorocentrum_lima.AAC.1
MVAPHQGAACGLGRFASRPRAAMAARCGLGRCASRPRVAVVAPHIMAGARLSVLSASAGGLYCSSLRLD